MTNQILCKNKWFRETRELYSGATIMLEEENEILTLTGLYVTNYFRQAMIAMFVTVFIPILVTSTH